MNAMSLSQASARATATDARHNASAMDPLYKTQNFCTALKLASERHDGIFQFSGVYLPTLILDATTRKCYLHADEDLTATHAHETTSVRHLKTLPDWVNRGHVVHLDTVLAEHRAALMHLQAQPSQPSQNIKAQVERGLLKFLRVPTISMQSA